MVTESIDLETLPETPSPPKRAETDPAKTTTATTDASPRERVETDPAKTDPVKKTTTDAPARRTMNMLTPDMLETLTTEVEPHTIQFTHASAASPRSSPLRTNRKNWNARTNANPRTTTRTRHTKSVRIDEEQNTLHSPSPKHYRRRKMFSSAPLREKTHHSHRAHHTRGGSDGGYVSSSSSSSGSSSSCSSTESYEPIPRAPDDWTVDETEENGKNDEENDSLLLPFYSNGSQGCDILSTLGAILSLPIACGLLCLDNLVDARIFPKIRKSKKQREDAMSTGNSSRRRSRKHRRRYSESDMDSVVDVRGCEYFPSSIELPVNKVIAPCW